jgi:hypothetical protein
MCDSITYSMRWFGLWKKAVHREICPKCGATVVEEVEGAQSHTDFKVMVNKEDFEPTEGACVVEEVFLMLF